MAVRFYVKRGMDNQPISLYRVTDGHAGAYLDHLGVWQPDPTIATGVQWDSDVDEIGAAAAAALAPAVMHRRLQRVRRLA